SPQRTRRLTSCVTRTSQLSKNPTIHLKSLSKEANFKMAELTPDFSGYATKNGLECSDGRTIMAGAFKHNDKMRVPLVWQHQHNDPGNILGHAVLENRADGVYAYGYFNDTPAGKKAKML